MSKAEDKRNREQQGRKVGYDLYHTLSEDDKAVIAFGMTPKELIDSFQDGLRDNLAKVVLTKKWLVPEETVNKMKPSAIQEVKDAINRDVIEEYTHGFVLGLMDGAKEADKMLV